MAQMTCNSPIGFLVLRAENNMLTDVFFSHEMQSVQDDCDTEILEMARLQLEQYFVGTRTRFELPLSIGGTPFQQKVYNALLDIPYAQVASYAEIARIIGHPNAYRAVGSANNRNRLAIIVPCHRVIGCDGSLTGYAGGLKKKRYLLDLELQCKRHP